MKQKLSAIGLLWLTIGIAIVFVVNTWWLRLILAIIAVGVTVHLAKMKTFREETSIQAPKNNLVDPAKVDLP